MTDKAKAALAVVGAVVVLLMIVLIAQVAQSNRLTQEQVDQDFHDRVIERLRQDDPLGGW